MTEQEIKITANIESSRPNTCKFVIDRPVCEGSFYFPAKEKAAGSPLAEKIFGWDEVAAVLVSGSSVTVTRTNSEDWRSAAKKIADIIREHIRSGRPAVDEKMKSTLLSNVELKNKVQELFDTVINPAVASHGGFVELVDVKDNKIFLRMGGGCQGCGQANATLRQGIETTLRQHLPQIGEILDATDHAAGSNPYYSSGH